MKGWYKITIPDGSFDQNYIWSNLVLVEGDPAKAKLPSGTVKFWQGVGENPFLHLTQQDMKATVSRLLWNAYWDARTRMSFAGLEMVGLFFTAFFDSESHAIRIHVTNREFINAD